MFLERQMSGIRDMTVIISTFLKVCLPGCLNLVIWVGYKHILRLYLLKDVDSGEDFTKPGTQIENTKLTAIYPCSGKLFLTFISNCHV